MKLVTSAVEDPVHVSDNEWSVDLVSFTSGRVVAEECKQSVHCPN